MSVEQVERQLSALVCAVEWPATVDLTAGVWGRIRARQVKDPEEQLELTRTQIRRRQELGDRLEVPRRVEHSGEFKTNGAARDAAAELRSLGYTVAVAKAGVRRFSLEALREDAVDLATAEALTREVAGVFDRHGGVYHGWGGIVVE